MIGDIPPISRRDKTLQTIYRSILFLFIAYMAVLTTIGAVKIYQVGNQVQGQTTFIVNYLRCIGQTPQQERGPLATNVCFDKYAPREVIKEDQ